jgi:hypothetical protein
VNIGRHTHPGPESGYMLEGDMVLLSTATEKTVRIGESYQVPSGLFTTPAPVRRGQGNRDLRRLKRQPLASPAP